MEVQERRRLKLFTPVWTGPIEGWVVNHISRNLWRVLPECEFDDLYQDAYMVFMTVANKYPVTEEEHFQSLFQRSFCNHVHAIANKRTSRGEVRYAVDAQDKVVDHGALDPTLLRLDWEILLEDAPLDVLALVKKALGRDKRSYRRRNESLNAYLCRLAGLRFELPGFYERLQGWLEGEITLA